MVDKPKLFPTDGRLAALMKKLEWESQPVKDVKDLAIVNAVRQIIGEQPYTVDEWNKIYFPSSTLH
jgi:hypothetical protein